MMTDKEYDGDSDLSPCPRCGQGVDWTCCRDINIHNNSIYCNSCGLDTFHSDAVKWLDLSIKPVGNFQERLYNLARDQYNDWCSYKPTVYSSEQWVHYTDKE